MNTVLDEFEVGKGKHALPYKNCSFRNKANTLTRFLVNSVKHDGYTIYIVPHTLTCKILNFYTGIHAFVVKFT